jgi:hypothetical protein
VADIRAPHIGGGLVVLALAVWYLWSHEGKTHTVTVPEETANTLGYYPYAWWAGHSRGEAYVHHYPDRVGPNVLPADPPDLGRHPVRHGLGGRPWLR